MLRTSYWKAFLVSIIIAIGGGSSSPSFNFNWTRGGNFQDFKHLFAAPGGDQFWPVFVAVLIVIIIIVTLAVLAFRIFLGYPLEIG